MYEYAIEREVAGQLKRRRFSRRPFSCRAWVVFDIFLFGNGVHRAIFMAAFCPLL
jgi:hypothetical protein